MNGIIQMQGGKNWILPKYINANRFFWDSHWLEILSNHFWPSMGPNGVSVATDSAPRNGVMHPTWMTNPQEAPPKLVDELPHGKAASWTAKPTKSGIAPGSYSWWIPDLKVGA
jgi:hypothetical protein